MKKICPIRYITKAFLQLASPGASIKEDFEMCTKDCKWYRRGKCLFVER